MIDTDKYILYEYIDGIPTMSDSFIMSLWERAIEEKISDDVMYTGNYTPNDFLSFVKYSGVELGVVCNEKDVMLVSYLTGRHFINRTAYQHFFVYRNYWNRSVELCKIGLREILKKYDVLYTMIPVNNIHACNMIKRLGVKPLGIVPNAAYWKKTNEKCAMNMGFIDKDILGDSK